MLAPIFNKIFVLMKKWLKRIGYTLLGIFIFINIVCAFQAYHLTHFYTDVPALNTAQLGFTDKVGIALFGAKVPKSKVVDSLKTPHESIKIKTDDGLTLAGWYLDNTNRDDTINFSKGTVIMFHGHASSRSGIIKEAEAFYNLGYNVFMIDFRAHGESDGDVCTIGYEESKDVKAAYEYVEKKGEKNIILYGISLGAATAMKAISDYNLRPSKIILEMPFGTLLDAVEGRLRIMGLPAEPLSALLTFWGGAEQVFWAFNHRPEEYAKKISCPVLLQWGKDDPRVTEKETDEIFSNLATKEKSIVKYDGCAHESLCVKANEKWMQSVSGFLNK